MPETVAFRRDPGAFDRWIFLSKGIKQSSVVRGRTNVEGDPAGRLISNEAAQASLWERRLKPQRSFISQLCFLFTDKMCDR